MGASEHLAVDVGRAWHKAGAFVVDDLDEGVDYDAISPGPSFLDRHMVEQDEHEYMSSLSSSHHYYYHHGRRRRSSGYMGRAVQSAYGAATPPLSASGSSMSSSNWTGSYRDHAHRPSIEPVVAPRGPQIQEYIEVWDYKGSAHFRGFTAIVPRASLGNADREPDRAMLVFLDLPTQQLDLKPGLMALMELASTSHFDCQRLLVCLERDGLSCESTGVSTATKSKVAAASDESRLLRDLRWVGFEPATLDEFASAGSTPLLQATSERWLLLGMDV